MLELGLARTPQNERSEPGGRISLEYNKELRVGNVALGTEIDLYPFFSPTPQVPCHFHVFDTVARRLWGSMVRTAPIYSLQDILSL
mmetsp:Transcript_7146/g.44347  ORF Transcript_7146/g.44347 Transcript_7146/m.44347 type:complete len:86 (-) Transcript_7146:474-731(-)